MARFVTTDFTSTSASKFIDSIAVTPHYFFVAKHTPYSPDDSSVPSVNTAPHTYTTSIYNDMLFGKKISTSDVKPMVPRYNWASGTAFAQYSDTDPKLHTKNFFACVNTGDYYNVYKCLSNSNDANSTVQPSGQDLDPFVTPADGYMWKYMYTFSSADHTKFSTDDFIPVVANTAVSLAAVGGSIETVDVNDAGTGYDNFYVDEFRAQDIAVNGLLTVFALTEEASGLNGFYSNCLIKVTSGVADGEYRLITNYVVSGGQKKITIASAFDVTPAATDTYEVYPAVFITGDGAETTDCVARAIVDGGAANSVMSVEVLTAGVGYRLATAAIASDPVVGVGQDADLTPVVSPADGHGADPVSELGASFAGLSIKFTESESNTIPIVNDYRQVGVLADPLFSNVHIRIDFSTQVGDFIQNEEVYNYRDIPLTGTVTTTANNAVVVGASTSFDNSLVAGDVVLLSSGTNRHLANVASVANSTQIVLNKNVPFANTTGTIKIVKPLANAIVVSANTSKLVLESCGAAFTNDYLKIVGVDSSTVVEIDDGVSPNVTINGASTGDFAIYVQLEKIEGEIVSGTFVADEAIEQGTATGKLFSYTANTPDHIYISNITGSFSNTSEIVGGSSNAVFTPSNKYLGALKPDSGKILYIENLSPITRASNKSETFKIILEF